MKLLNQIEEVDQELEKVIHGEQNTLAIVSLEEVYNALDPSLTRVCRSISQRKELQLFEDRFTNPTYSESEKDALLSTFKRLQQFMTIWLELEQKYQVCQNNVLALLRGEIDSLSSLLQERSIEAYSNWVRKISDEVYVSESDIEKQESSPALKDNARHYLRLLASFQDEIARKSITKESINKIDEYRQQLIDAKDKMDYDLPEDVLRLFKHLKQIGNNSRAPLSMLTPEVLKWLVDEGQDGFFYVGDKRIG